MTSPEENHAVQHEPKPHGNDHVTDHHGDHSAAAALPFTEAEWAGFQKSDVHAAAAIAGLMASIFSIGLLLYATIAIIVAASPV
jgi:hypothetical protein